MTSRLLDAHTDLVESRTLARIAVPIFLSSVAFAIVLTALGGIGDTRVSATEAAPTPYSADHARIQGPAAEQPPTF